MTLITQCECNHEDQDKMYGKGNRVFNKTAKTPGTSYRCTICGNIIKR